ncbi:toll-like receptor 4 [Gigantopelta aegis]|uniref:toll-like receptor 4 n=1 Tax=Gigantopelta aegis TaxID=1735272 RepID=UPI001B88C7A6|nr:toll-like receptor 4 [Gigantopelta aegis]
MEMNKVVLFLCVVFHYCVTSIIRAAPSTRYHCGGLCRCEAASRSALCDGHGENTLRHGVPRLPSFIQNLTLKSFNIQIITKETFVRVKTLNLTVLKITNSTIVDIEEDAFSVFSHCRNLSLVIGHNVIAETVTSKALKGLRALSLDYLDLRHLNISDTDDTFFDTLSGTSVRHICVSKNYLTKYNHSKFVNVSNLFYLDLSGNDINVTMLTYSYVLRTLQLSYNRITQFPILCQGNQSIFPNLDRLMLDHNYIQNIQSKQFNCLTKLRQFDLSRNYFATIGTNMFAYLPNLESLRLRNMFYGIVLVHRYAFNNSHLKELILRDNRIEILHSLDKDSFSGCHRLEGLDLSYNQVTKLPKRDKFMERLIGHLHSLRFLSLGSSNLFEIPRIVMNLTNLEVLELYTNYISKLPDGFFSRMPKLKMMYISTNSFSTLKESDFPSNLYDRVELIDFSGNPFVCDCNLLWFVEWLRREPARFGHIDKYTCTNSDGSTESKLLTDANISLKACLVSVETAMSIVILSIFVIILLMTSSLVYKWRWMIKYYIYMLRYKNSSSDQTDHDYMFDAYVIYCAENRKWVLEEAIPNLERSGVCLCIHERDFMPGALIVNNIVDSLRRSRTVMLVLSNDFAKSHWCQFEMCLCQTYLLENGRGLLLAVLLEEIKSCHVTKSMYAVLKTTTYCTWPGEDEEAKSLFWERMRKSLVSTSR